MYTKVSLNGFRTAAGSASFHFALLVVNTLIFVQFWGETNYTRYIGNAAVHLIGLFTILVHENDVGNKDIQRTLLHLTNLLILMFLILNMLWDSENKGIKN
jgi:hypothetical protein